MDANVASNVVLSLNLLSSPPHHRCDVLRNVLAQGPYARPKRDQQVEVLTRRQGFQVLGKPTSQRRKGKTTNKRVTRCKLLQEIRRPRCHAAMISAFADQE